MKRTYLTAIFASCGMLILILDSKTALQGASEGITLCLQTVLPSLFPFFILSILLTNTLSGVPIPLISPLFRLLHIPAGAESILLTGFLGGYPIGAKSVADAVNNGYISRENGKRMLAFCSNAGPAFLFGIGAHIFPNRWMCWVLWAIHIVSALLVGMLLPHSAEDPPVNPVSQTFSISEALKKSIASLAGVCGWVVIFRVILHFADRWFLWLLPQWGQCFLIGLCELTNGCCNLVMMEDVGIRFVLFSVFLGFGGLCVCMQTVTVCKGLDTSFYLPGKLTQSLISGTMAGMVISREISHMVCCAAATVLICTVFYLLSKKGEKHLAFSSGTLYNEEKLHMR